MKPRNPKTLKIRASQINKVVTFDRSTQVTEKQLQTIETLEAKESLTEKQAEELERLISKRDAKPELSAGGKTYVKELFNEHVSGTKRNFSSKYTDKGNAVENKVIAETCKFIGLPTVVKNEEFYRNEYAKGTPDTKFIPLGIEMDVKSVYYPHNLDFFEYTTDENGAKVKKIDPEYEWQQHCYNWLLGTKTAIVAKVLVNPPEDILEKEVSQMAKTANIFPVTDDFREEVRQYFDFESKMDIKDRVNVYTFETTKEHIDRMIEGVKLAREYYAELCRDWETKNEFELSTIRNKVQEAIKQAKK